MSELDSDIENKVLEICEADNVISADSIQTLWSGYGEIVRLRLANSRISNVIVKHVKLPDTVSHPRGWNTKTSHRRKIHSYEVECDWYRDWSQCCHDLCRVPKSYFVQKMDTEFMIVMEDLDAAGYASRITEPSIDDMKRCLFWLANFHAQFMGVSPFQNKEATLWNVGTYWHLSTRWDEFDALPKGKLRSLAKEIDDLLNQCSHKTIVHGDAKLANFCFSPISESVAAVDFQYIGGGCGIKDVMLFMSSCLDDSGCEKHEKMLLDYYFEQLHHALIKRNSSLDFEKIEVEWRDLYKFAWADFVRFLEGWSPGHWKINSYSERLVREVLEDL